MKILQVCSSASWGGIELQTLKVTGGLKKHGHDTRILCSDSSFICREAIQNGFPFYTGIFGKHNFFRSLKVTRKILKSFNPDVIHVQLSHDLSVLSIALRLNRMKTPLLFTRRMESGVKKTSIIHRIIYSRVNYAYCISSFIRDNFIATSPMPEHKVGVMHNGIDLLRFEKKRFDPSLIRKELGIPENALIIGTTGRLSVMKGYEEFIECASRLNEQADTPLFFLMVGGTSHGEETYAEKITTLASQKITEGNFLFTGHTPEVEKYLSVMNIFVFASHRESFGNVLLEAAAMEIPIAASNSGGATDIIICGKTAVCFDARNVDKMEDAILKLLNNTDQAREMAIKAHNDILSRFSDEVFFRKLLTEYERFNKKGRLTTAIEN